MASGDKKALLDAFGEVRRTWDDLIGLQPDIVAASGPFTSTDLSELEMRLTAHRDAVTAFAHAVDTLRNT
jgi:hypothetical protein